MPRVSLLPTRFATIALGVFFLSAVGLHAQELGQSVPTERLNMVFGLAADPGNSSDILIATQYGVARASPAGMATLTSDLGGAVIGLAANPGIKTEIFLSAVSMDNQPIGVFKSLDGGANWDLTGSKNIAPRGFGFSATSNKMIAITDKILTSEDAGKTWQPVPTSPEKVFSAAISPADDRTLFAATITGLQQSTDNGQSWQKSYPGDQPATLVKSLSKGRLVAFIYGVGLVERTLENPDWRVLNESFEERYLSELIEDPENPDVLYTVVDTGAILTSFDAGKSWTSFEGSDKYTPARVAAGEALFRKTCQVCHGVKGIGESPGDPGAQDEFGFKAPALNNDMHAWHHSDKGLLAKIHLGSPRNERMVAFEKTLSDDNIDDILSYIKSLWSLRNLSCQGARHGGCAGN